MVGATRRRKWFGLAMGSAIVAGVILASIPGQAAGSGQRHIELFVDESAGFDRFVDVDGNGAPSPGDVDVERQPVISLDSGKRIGTSVSHIVIVKPVGRGDLLALVDDTVVLPRGRVLVSGAFRLSELEAGATFAIIGGTGAFAGAGGTASVTNGTRAGHAGQFVTIDLI